MVPTTRKIKAPKNETSDLWALATITYITERKFEKGNARIPSNLDYHVGQLTYFISRHQFLYLINHTN